MRYALLGFLLLFATAAHCADEAEIKKHLPGVWEGKQDAHGIKVTGVTEYKADGKFSGKASVTMFGKTTDYTYEGTWKVTGSKLQYTIAKSSDAEMMKPGMVITDEVLEINEKSLKYKDQMGETVTETRKK